MPDTRVVHVNGPGGYDVYIGRASPRKGLKASVWANPFKIGRDGTRDEVIAKYRTYLQTRRVLKVQGEKIKKE